MVLFSVPKAQITSFLSPAHMSAIMTALSSLVGLWNRNNSRHSGFNITLLVWRFQRHCNNSNRRLCDCQQCWEKPAPNTTGIMVALKTKAEINLWECEFCADIFIKPTLNKTAKHFSLFLPQPLPWLSYALISINVNIGYNIFPEAHLEWHGTFHRMRQCVTEENLAKL